MEDKQQEEEVAGPWAWIRATQDILNSPPFHEPPKLPVELLPWLFISDMVSVRRNIWSLKAKMGITHVLTTNSMSDYELEVFQTELQQASVQHCIVPGEDEFGYDMIGKH